MFTCATIQVSTFFKGWSHCLFPTQKEKEAVRRKNSEVFVGLLHCRGHQPPPPRAKLGEGNSDLKYKKIRSFHTISFIAQIVTEKLPKAALLRTAAAATATAGAVQVGI